MASRLFARKLFLCLFILFFLLLPLSLLPHPNLRLVVERSANAPSLQNFPSPQTHCGKPPRGSFALPNTRSLQDFHCARLGRSALVLWYRCLAATGVQSKRIVVPTHISLKNCVFWDVTPCGSCKNRRFGGT
jgi:hypothetical protein